MSCSKPSIAVIGGTGVLGGSVARHFGNRLGFNVHTISRNPQSAAAFALRRDVAGVNIVEGDLGDPGALYQLFKPVHVVYMCTFFWKLRGDPRTIKEADSTSIPVDEVAMRREEEHYRNLFDAIARVNQERGTSGVDPIARVIISTLPNPRAISKGRYCKAYHFESRARGLLTLQEERPGYHQIQQTASYIYLGVYLQAFFNSKLLSVHGRPIFGPERQDDGSFLFKQVASKPFRPIPFICPAKDLGRLVEALSQDAPPGTHLLGGQPLTLEDFITCWGQTLQVPVHWQPASIEDVLEIAPGASHGFLRGALESSAFVTEYGFDGGLGAQWPSDVGVKPNELADISQWIRETDWSEWPEVAQASTRCN